MVRQLKPCGTPAAYARHLRHHELPCDACTAANTARVQANRREVALIMLRRADLAAAVYNGDQGRRAARRAARLRGELS